MLHIAAAEGHDHIVKFVLQHAPRTAQAHDVRDGDMIDLHAGERALRELTVRVRDTVPEGTVTLLDGIAEAPANVFAAGELVRPEKQGASTAQPVGAQV